MVLETNYFFSRFISRVWKGNEDFLGIGGWLTVDDGRLLNFLSSLLGPSSVAVEIGSYKGRSGTAIVTGLGEGSVLYCIDTFKLDGTPCEKKHDTFADFSNNMKKYKDKVVPIRKFSYDAIKEWDHNKKIDFLFLDGEHSYEAALKDMQDWCPLLKDGGIIAVHDYKFNRVNQAMESIIDNIRDPLYTENTYAGVWRK